MSKIAVIYQSHYGSTKKYAEWIAQDLKAPLFERKKCKPAMLKEYDIIVYGGGLYAGGIAGVELVRNNPCKNLVVFSVGLSDPATTDFSVPDNKMFPSDIYENVRMFHLQGGIDYSQMSFVHKSMMGMLTKIIKRKPASEWSDQEKGVMSTFGGKADFTDKQCIAPMIEYIRSLEK